MKFQQVKVAREKKGWSQERLAAESGVSLKTVSNVERGKGCNFGTAKLLGRALGMTLAEIKGAAC
jgi:transcriptional regulator with XRE-family HTH domain